MKIINTPIEGLRILEPKIFKDIRGTFTKTFNDDFFEQNGLNIFIKETFYTISHKNVIRGMHFQTPPFDHIKLVYVPSGSILDVVVDIRKDSPTYGKSFNINLSNKNQKVLIIPKGLAHGYKSLNDNTVVIYMQTACYAPSHDSGIKYDSFGFDWNCSNPKLSARDLLLETLENYLTPFVFEKNI